MNLSKNEFRKKSYRGIVWLDKHLVKLPFSDEDFTRMLLESLIAGFYVAITRGLAPLFLTVYGMSISEILKLNLVANAFALAAASPSVLVYRLKASLLHERAL